MVSIVKVNGKPNSSNYAELMYEDSSDIQNLPTDVAVGSYAVKIDGSALYRLDSSGTWIEVIG